MIAGLDHALPDVYPFAAFLGERFDCTHAIAIGEPSAASIARLSPQFQVWGIVPSSALDEYRNRFARATWIEGVLDRGGDVVIDPDVLKRSVIVCADLLGRLANPSHLLAMLEHWLRYAPVAIVTARPVRWTRTQFEHALRAEGLNVQFVGMTAGDAVGCEKDTVIAVITNDALARANELRTPSGFRVAAFMAAYNEEDIIVHSIKDWTDQGVEVHILENWSTDATYDLARELSRQLPVTVHRFPKDGPSPYFDWEAMLREFEALSSEIPADWFVRRGADEVLTSPWPGLTYRDGLYLVDRSGFNCVDHTVIEFQPVDDGFRSGTDHEAHFKYFDFGKHPAHFFQRKAWKNCRRPISMAPSGGHDLPFEGRRIHPFKFLLKHYPVRSQSHGEKKVFRERKARWNPEERAKGWHNHYDAIQEGHVFLRPPTEQKRFEEHDFNTTYLVERLSGVGVIR